MARKIWFVRNTHRLLNIIGIIAIGVIFIYSFLNMLMLEADGKLMLLLLPTVSLLLYGLCYWWYKNAHKKSSISLLEAQKQEAGVKIARDTAIGINLLQIAIISFWQLEFLYNVKGTDGSYASAIMLTLLLVPIFLFVQAGRTRKLKRNDTIKVPRRYR